MMVLHTHQCIVNGAFLVHTKYFPLSLSFLQYLSNLPSRFMPMLEQWWMGKFI